MKQKATRSNYHTVLVACLLLASLGHTKVSSASDELWAELKDGGKVVLMRHAPVAKGKGKGNPLVRDPTCKEERNLSDKGKIDAGIVGTRFKERGVPVSEVRHSPYCRTTDTARIAFGGIHPLEHLSLLEALNTDEAVLRSEALSEIIGSYVGDGNLVLISHEPNITAVSFELVKHLDFLVLQPKGGSEFEELGVVRFTGSD